MYQAARDCAVKPSGLWLDSTGCLGGSPDGIVSDSVIVEVKCPYSLRDTTVCSALADPNFFLTRNDAGDIIVNKRSTLGLQYYHQMQGNLHLTSRSQCDFVVWTPQEMAVIDVEKDACWADNLDLLRAFYRDSFLPVFIAGGV